MTAFAQAAAAGDGAALWDAMQQLELHGPWRRAMRRVARVGVPADLRARFLGVWRHSGDGLRSDVNDDRVLIDGLRALLPAYGGGTITLYRGDSAWNHRRRSWGLSWSARRDVAQSFAEGLYRTFEGGSVVLAVDAPPAAIICAVPEDEDTHEEAEYIVDRRRLRGVRVVERLADRRTA